MVGRFFLGVVFGIVSFCSVREVLVIWGYLGIYLMKIWKELLRESNLILEKRGRIFSVDRLF